MLYFSFNELPISLLLYMEADAFKDLLRVLHIALFHWWCFYFIFFTITFD